MRSVASFASGFFNERNFEYQGNVLVSLSGGRSSAAMLRLLLDHYGTLPKEWKVVFTNTAKEHSATYEFLQRQQEEWKVEIVWLELTALISDRKVAYKIVDFNSAGRDGEPFYVLQQAKPHFPPRRSNRLCTVYMKVLTSQSYLQDELGWQRWTHLLGYRSDETQRLHRALLRCGKGGLPYVPDAPLIRAGIDKEAVGEFFKQNSFDLQLSSDCGNCDCCFLKGEPKIRKVMRALGPEIIDWWVALDQGWSMSPKANTNQTTMYILPNGGYAGIKERAMATMPPTEPDDNIEDLECDCTD